MSVGSEPSWPVEVGGDENGGGGGRRGELKSGERSAREASRSRERRAGAKEKEKEEVKDG